MFKVGDRVRRKPECQDCELQDRVLTVAGESSGVLSFAESRFTWNSGNFDLVKPADPVPQYSTITQYIVGPYLVTVVCRSGKSARESIWDSRNPLGLVKVLQECEEDYRDPEMSHEDMLERLRDRLVSIEGVTQIDIVGVNDGCGVCISLEG